MLVFPQGEKSIDIQPLRRLAADVRGRVIELSHLTETPHLGSSLSCVDILVALYATVLKIDPKRADDVNRDRFILSKGHAALALYVTLSKFGFFPESDLEMFAKPGSTLAEQPSPFCRPGVEAATGSLGHGLPIAAGQALSAKIFKRTHEVYALLSDGECNEGSVWEAALFAPANKLNNLTVIIDFNKWQATGRSEEVMQLGPFKEKWQAFGWEASEVNGNDMQALVSCLRANPRPRNQPRAIIAHTVKGKGVSFMEDDNNWHYRIPTADEVVAAKKELGCK